MMIAPIFALFASATQLPPIQYRGDATATVEFIDPEAVPALCSALGAPPLRLPRYALACTVGTTIIMPNPCAWPNRSDYRDMLCHELGHKNGWPADHPKEDGR